MIEAAGATSNQFSGTTEKVDAMHPWPGLESFQEQDSKFFRGRAATVEELFRLVLRERVTVLHSRSGLGKSSLLQAGLFPRLRQDHYLPAYIRLQFTESGPPFREQVLRAIQDAVSNHNAATLGDDQATRIDAPPILGEETLWEHFHRTDSEYWTGDNRPLVPVLTFDQFEEVFTRGWEGRRSEGTTAFLEELGDLIEGRAPLELEARIAQGGAKAETYSFRRHYYKVVIGIREDFLAQLEKLESGLGSGQARRAIPSLRVNRMSLEPLSGVDALSVTTAGGPRLISPAVGESIVRLVAGEADTSRPLEELVVDPALLSLFCSELNDRRLEGREGDSIDVTPEITTAFLEGNRQTILAKFYEDSVSKLDPAVRRFVEDELLNADDWRDTVSESNALAVPGVTREAIDHLVLRRLIRREERDGQVRIELTHDVLIDPVKASRDTRVAKEMAEQRTLEERARREAAERRENAERLAAETRDRQTHRQMRIALGVGAGFLLLAATTMVGWRRAQNAEIRAKGLATIALNASLDAKKETAQRTLEAARADSAERKAREAEANARATSAALAVQNGELSKTLSQLRTTQTIRTVEAEAADQYLRLGGQLVSWKAAAESANAATARKDVQNAAAIRAEANARLAVVERIICPGGKSTDSATATLRERLRSALEADGLLPKGESLCAGSAGMPETGKRE